MIHVEEKPYSVVMRTPGQEVYQAAGLFLGEGIIDSKEDFDTIGFDEKLDTNVIDIWLKPERREKIKHLLKRQSYVSQTSCGICGKKMIEDLNQVLRPAKDGFEITVDDAMQCVNGLSDKQRYYPRTRGSHAALIFDRKFSILTFAEDVGRHNALDKAIGRAFMEDRLSEAGLVVMSSRISYELVQKTARAKIPMMISKSRPTGFAVQMGKSLNMTLACAFERSKLIIFSGGHRIIPPKK